MKKFIAILMVITSLFSFTSCGLKTTKRPEKLSVYTTFYPLYDLTKKIAGDKANVKNIIPPGVEPHDWEPTTKDVANITNASLVVYLGLGMDSWIGKMQSASSSSTKFVEVSKGITPIKQGNSINPHVWLSPKESLVLAKNIKDALISVDSKDKNYYTKNYGNLKNSIVKLNNEYSTNLKNTKLKTFIVYHSAFDYIARDYGLNQVSVVGISEDAEASPAKIVNIIKLIKKEKIRYIFTEPLTSPKPMQTIANETGAKLLPLNTIEGLTNDEIKQGYDYIKMMQQNLLNLEKALQ